jgi:hypothetical protein
MPGRFESRSLKEVVKTISIGTGWTRAVNSRLLLDDELYAIECEDVTQELMMLDVLKKRCQIEFQLQRRLVYINAFTTAPWNRPSSLISPT